ncbi:YraN family protein [Solicola sp. PLA-1-18]|uniref:YraN family protein n=1 Tax=Solicola sp. PLA-1-18 TaxID=3380532 RepID=UPI003B7E48E7
MGSTQAQKDAVGRYGEDVAVAHLEQAGMRVLARNWRCRHGEVDVVALDGGTVVVCEVKTRRSRAQGSPFEAVTPQKASRLRRLAAAWLEANPMLHEAVRIDVVGVVVPSRGRAHVERVTGVC